jgi:2-(1,2-epoxy-1,2-dihydrophenyl)acetyl-CoA isomerase
VIINLDSFVSGSPLDADVRAGVRAALKEARKSDTAVLLTGSAGTWNHACAPGDARSANRDFHSLVVSLVSHPVPVIAAVAGKVSGLGLALAAAADVRIAQSGSTFQVGDDRDATGLTTGSFRMLTALLGRAHAEALVYSARTITADEAVAIGLVSQADASQADGEMLLGELSGSAASSLKRAATSASVAELTERLAFDAWLALTAAEETR